VSEICINRRNRKEAAIYGRYLPSLCRGDLSVVLVGCRYEIWLEVRSRCMGSNLVHAYLQAVRAPLAAHFRRRTLIKRCAMYSVFIHTSRAFLRRSTLTSCQQCFLTIFLAFFRYFTAQARWFNAPELKRHSNKTPKRIKRDDAKEGT
jgi:hypothetical protein